MTGADQDDASGVALLIQGKSCWWWKLWLQVCIALDNSNVGWIWGFVSVLESLQGQRAHIAIPLWWLRWRHEDDDGDDYEDNDMIVMIMTVTRNVACKAKEHILHYCCDDCDDMRMMAMIIMIWIWWMMMWMTGNVAWKAKRHIAWSLWWWRWRWQCDYDNDNDNDINRPQPRWPKGTSILSSIPMNMIKFPRVSIIPRMQVCKREHCFKSLKGTRLRNWPLCNKFSNQFMTMSVPLTGLPLSNLYLTKLDWLLLTKMAMVTRKIDDGEFWK